MIKYGTYIAQRTASIMQQSLGMLASSTTNSWSERKTSFIISNIVRCHQSAGVLTENLQRQQKRPISSSTFSLHESMQLKKRFRRKREDELNKLQRDRMVVSAFATADKYDLKRLEHGLREQNLYELKQFFSNDDMNGMDTEPDALHLTFKHKLGDESRDMYIFREGTVVLWNCTELESSNMLRTLKKYEQTPYDEGTVSEESETMLYDYNEAGPAKLSHNSFYVSKTDEGDFEKYTFSNAMSLSVKLGIWETSLERYIDSMAFVTADLKNGSKIKVTRSEMLRRTGELFALRHVINLSSDLLDTPDFYWDREQLEKLYNQSCSYFSITRRTRVMNEKLNHCVELADLISSKLNDDHHVRLEWMIIVLIMVEVGFEGLHYIK